MTYDEKRQLGLDIANLPEDRLHGVVEIIMRGEPSHRDCGPEEIEIDLEILQQATLRELARYAKMVLEQNAPASGMQISDGVSVDSVPSKSRKKTHGGEESGRNAKAFRPYGAIKSPQYIL